MNQEHLQTKTWSEGLTTTAKSKCKPQLLLSTSRISTRRANKPVQLLPCKVSRDVAILTHQQAGRSHSTSLFEEREWMNVTFLRGSLGEDARLPHPRSNASQIGRFSLCLQE